MGFKNLLTSSLSLLLLSLCNANAAEIRFSDQYDVGYSNNNSFGRAISEFNKGGGKFLVAWISLDPQQLELVLNPESISEEQIQEQGELIEETFALLSEELVQSGNLKLPKHGNIISGASMYVMLDEVAFRRIRKNPLVTDIFIVIEDAGTESD